MRATAKRREARISWLIGIILGVTLVKGALWSAAVPIWQAPDEPSHFAVVQFIAENGRLPRPSDDCISLEVRTSMRQSGMELVAFRPGGQQEFATGLDGPNEALLRAIPMQDRRTPNSHSTATTVPPLYYIIGAIMYRLVYGGNILTRLFAVRQVSVLLTAFTVWLAYRIARLTFPDQEQMWVTVPVLVSFHPMFTFIASVVNTDVLLVALSSWGTYVLLLVVKSGFTTRRAVALGLVIGLGILTKPQIWFLLPPLALVAALEFVQRRIVLRRLAFFFILIALVSLVVGGWSLVRNQLLNKNPFYAELRSNMTPQPDATLGEYLWVYEDRLTQDLFKSYWGRFGWLDTPLQTEVYHLLRIVVCIAAAGVIAYTAAWSRRRPSQTDWLLLVQAVYILTFLLGFVVPGFALYRQFGVHQPSQGRYFFAPLVCQMTLMAVGLLTFVPRKWHPVGHIVMQFTAILFHLYVMLNVIIPRYYVLVP